MNLVLVLDGDDGISSRGITGVTCWSSYQYHSMELMPASRDGAHTGVTIWDSYSVAVDGDDSMGEMVSSLPT